MEHKVYAVSSNDYREKEILHIRRLIHLHFDLDLPLYPFCFEDQIRSAADAWFDSPGVCSRAAAADTGSVENITL